MKATFNIAAAGGTFVVFLRASMDARSGPNPAGSFYSIEITPTSLTPGGDWSAVVTAKKVINGSVTILQSYTVPCNGQFALRAAIRPDVFTITSDQTWYWVINLDGILPAGRPGVGAYGTAPGNAISSVQLGPADRIAPAGLLQSSVGSSSFANRVDLQWQGAQEDTNGSGVWMYHVFRDGVFRHQNTTPAFTDLAVSPSTTYQYAIQTVDYHWNYSPPVSITVTTPPAGAIDSRRAGVRPTGKYWGGAGEQVDMVSGNLNFTVPLLSAQGRGGWSVPFALSYNSQMWRQDPGGTWKLGSDVGYGFGWRLMAGALTPYWISYAIIDHYRYVDSTGAEYRLDVNTNGVWTSKEGIYISYDEDTQRLYFPDGSFWLMDAESYGAEQDAGTRYPTLMQDSNGNQVRVRYHPGQGVGWSDSSARIKEIEDVRAVQQPGTGVYVTYEFSYNTDSPVPHLAWFSNWIGSAESGNFSYTSAVLDSPFTPSVSYGNTSFLSGVHNSTLNMGYTFQYSDGSAGGRNGELSLATLPYGASIQWSYVPFTYSGSRILREVGIRYFSKQPGAGSTPHTFERDPIDASKPAHTYALVRDSTGQKTWSFHEDSWRIGLVSASTEGDPNAANPKRRHDYIWTQDAAGNPFIASVLTTVDPAMQYQKQMKTEQTVDTHGNITQTKIYDWNSLATPARTYTHTYLTGAAYASRRIWNRLTGTSVTGAGQTVQLLTQSYDTTDVNYHSMPTARQHDPAYNEQFFTRGNVRRRTAPGKTIKFEYDIGGNVRVSSDDYGHQATATITANYAAPGLLTPNNSPGLATSLSYNSFLGLTQESGPNGSTAYVGWGSGRPTSTTSPDGAVTTYAYGVSGFRYMSATTNGRWSLTSYDGIGRVIQVQKGNGSSTTSVVDTEYAPCACSPLGKVSRVSQPYVPGATIYWTTYTYDSLGRTVSVSHPANSGTTTYLYEGNTVKVTDPAGKWKKLFVDALGNLTQATEPNPAGGTG